jgi:hypothetical protein
MSRSPVSIPASALALALILTASCDPSGTGDVGTQVRENALLANLVQINAGGMASGTWQADAYFAGGRNGMPGKNAIVTTGIAAPAPQDVYQTSRVGTMTYTIGPFSSNVPATVTLHFAETYHSKAGLRTFNVDINGTRVLTNFDVWATAAAMPPVLNPPNGKDHAVVESFNTTTDARGNVAIKLSTVIDNALISGIQISASAPRQCTSGTKRCQAATVQTCDANGVWQNTTACSGNTPVCDPTTFTCVKEPNARACTSAAQCASGHCVDGVCCDTACTGQCQACDGAHAGTCSPIMGAPHNGRAACAGAGTICGGSCNGVSTSACTYPTTACRAASCADGKMLNNAASCSGGSCPALTQTTCPNTCIASSATCGGTCSPGTARCNGNALQTCDQAGNWATSTTCANPTPICDPTQKKCVGCSSSGQCASGLCSGGACCASLCNGTCQAGTCDSTGTCSNVATGTQCGMRVLGSNEFNNGLNNIALFCNDQHACVGPSISCGGSPNPCDLTKSVCCQNQPSTPSQVQIACVAAPSQCCDGVTNCSGNSDQRWYGCKSNLDCPNGQLCCADVNFLGTFGIQFAECRTSCSDPFNEQMCDPQRATAGQCPSGTTCHLIEGDQPDYAVCY